MEVTGGTRVDDISVFISPDHLPHHHHHGKESYDTDEKDNVQIMKIVFMMMFKMTMKYQLARVPFFIKIAAPLPPNKKVE